MSDPRDELLKKIKFDDIDVSEYPKIAFVCGGDPTQRYDEESKSNIFPSVRSYISNCLTVNYGDLRFQNAEDVKDWNNYSLYNDLIEFEKDVAHICKVIVLFVESPGSIAELGSFAVIREISEKLIVFVHEDYAKSTSFISLGALKKIESEKIHYIGWKNHSEGSNIGTLDVTSLNKWQTYTCDSIRDAIEKRSSFNRSTEEHSRTKEVLFIHDLIILFKAITEEEIKNYFKIVGHEVKSDLLSKAVFCLDKLGLIRAITKGNKTFLVPVNTDLKKFLSLPIRIDTARLAAQVDTYYQHGSQMLRREAIEAMKAGGKL